MIILKELYAENFKGFSKVHLTDLNKNDLTLIHGKNGSGKCLEGNSYIFYNKSLTKIKDIHTNWNFTGFKKSIKSVAMVGGKEVNTSHIYTDKVESTIKIDTTRGFFLEGTHSHPILVIGKDCKFKFKKLSEITLDDYVCIERTQGVFPEDNPDIDYIKEYKDLHNNLKFTPPKKFNKYLAGLLGYYIANGSYQEKVDIATISTNNKVLINDLKNIAFNLNTEFNSSYAIKLGGVNLSRYLKYLLDGNTSIARTKEVPSIILNSNKECQATFLRALIDSDGWYSKKGTTLEYYTSSKELAKVVHLMLLNFGIISRLYYKDSAKIKDKVYNHKYYTITITSQNIDIYFNEIGSLIYKLIPKERNPNIEIIPYFKELIYNEVNRIKAKFNVNKGGTYKINGDTRVFINTNLIKSAAINITYGKLINFLKELEKDVIVYKEFNKEILATCNVLLSKNFYFDRVINKEIINEEKQIYDITVPLYHYFISNGFISHNSSVRHLIEYLLTDTTSESIPLDELTYNKNGNCYMMCILNFNDDEVKIEKYREHKEHMNNTIITVNGNSDSFTHTDRRETQKELENLLGINKDILNISTIFSQYSGSFPEEKETKRKKIIYDVKDLHKYQDMSNRAKAKCKELEQNISNNTYKLDAITESIQDIKTYIDTINIEIEKFEEDKEKELQRLIDEVSSIDTKKFQDIIDNIINQLHVIDQDRYEELKRELNLKEHELLTAKKELDKIYMIEEDIEKLDIKTLQKEKSILYSNLNNTKESELEDIDNTISNILQDKTKVNSELKSIYKEIADTDSCTCPILLDECKRLASRKDEVKSRNAEKITILENYLFKFNLDLDESKEIKQGILNRIDSDNKLKSNIAVIDSKFEYINKRKDELQELLDIPVKEKKENMDYLSTECTIIEHKLEDIQVKINENKEYNTLIEKNKEELARALVSRKDYNNRIVTLEAKDNPSKALKEETINKKKKKEHELKELKDTIKKDEEELKYYMFWVIGYGKQGIPNMKTETFLDSIEYETNKILASISERMFVEIESQKTLKSNEVKEKIDYRVRHPEKTITSFFAYSGGQRQRVLLADKFAFNELLGKFNFIMLDEVLEISLDDHGKESVISLLREKSKTIKPIFVISHDDTIKGSFDNIIEIKFKNGQSNIM